MTRRAAFAVVPTVVLLLAGWEPFRTPDPDVEAGNRAYAEGRYDDALAAYDRAARRGGVDGDGLAFDRGTAELKKAEATHDAAEKQRLAQRALDDLKQAAHARDPRIRGQAHYNRGNLLMGQDKLDDAIEAYKQALREQPELDDARTNLEVALRKRQKQQSAQQNQPGQGQGQQGQGQGQGQGQSQQPPGQPDQPGQGQGQGQGQGSPSSPGQPGNGNGQGSSDGSAGSNAGSNQPQGGGSQGANPPPSGQSAPQSGSNQAGSNAGSNQPDPRNPAPRSRQRGRGPQSPKTPADGKLDDLDNFSRRLQKDEARRHATGKVADPQHDW